MELTGKAKEDFDKWLCETQYVSISYNIHGDSTILDIDGMNPSSIAITYYYIEWLDSVGIYISIESVFDNMLGYHRGFQVQIYQDGKQPISIDKDNDVFESRQQATEAAIKEANEIYNSRK